MTRALAVLRPEPGNAATAARVEALGLRAIRLPLFAVRPLAWAAPDPEGFDALLLTSANAVRHAGPALARLRALPVLAVGAATARAAAEAEFEVALVGKGGVEALLAEAGERRALYLHAEEARVPVHRTIAHAVPIYASTALPLPPEQLAPLRDTVALLHSTRAACRLRELLPATDRARVGVAALSPAVAEAAGDGWARVTMAAKVSDAALIASARD